MVDILDYWDAYISYIAVRYLTWYTFGELFHQLMIAILFFLLSNSLWGLLFGSIILLTDCLLSTYVHKLYYIMVEKNDNMNKNNNLNGKDASDETKFIKLVENLISSSCEFFITCILLLSFGNFLWLIIQTLLMIVTVTSMNQTRNYRYYQSIYIYGASISSLYLTTSSGISVGNIRSLMLVHLYIHQIIDRMATIKDIIRQFI